MRLRIPAMGGKIKGNSVNFLAKAQGEDLGDGDIWGAPILTQRIKHKNVFPIFPVSHEGAQGVHRRRFCG